MDVNFSRLLPDKYCATCREFLLNLINSYTGAQFEQYLKRVQIDLIQFQRNLSASLKEETVFADIPNDEYYNSKLQAQKSLYAVKPRYAKRDKLPGMVLKPGTNTFLNTHHSKLATIDEKTSPNDVLAILKDAFPYKMNILAYFKMRNAEYDGGILTINIDVYQKRIRQPRGDPLIMRYLTYLDTKDHADFISAQLGTRQEKIKVGEISFYMQIDAAIEARPKLNMEGEIVSKSIEPTIEDAKVKQDSKLRQLYEKALTIASEKKAEYLQERELIEKFNKKLNLSPKSALTAFRATAPHVTYPKNIQVEAFPWDEY